MPDRLMRRNVVDPSDQTPGREAAADWIESTILDDNRLPMSYKAIAEASADAEAGPWSRQHITNTIKAYFWEDDAARLRQATDDGGRRFESLYDAYREGYREGYRDGQADADSE